MISLRELAFVLGGEVSGGQVMCPGPGGHSPRDRSLSVKPSATSPHGFILRSFAGDDWRDCRDYVRDRLGLDPEGWKRDRDALTPRRRAVHDLDEATRLKRAAAIWNEATPIAGTVGEAYLAKRGIMLDDVPDRGGLRWHAKCRWGTGTAPCVVARFTDAISAEPRGIWRRPLAGEKPKSLGPTSGCVIRLWPDDSVELGLVLGEGVETVLAAATRITHQGAYLRPAWAAGSSSNMAAFPPLAGVEALTLLVDHDDNGAGERAAEQCARHWRSAGRQVIRLMPGAAGDFNDLVRP
jgi:putative DNA primase/helicase